MEGKGEVDGREMYEGAGCVDACSAGVGAVEPLGFREAEEAMFGHAHCVVVREEMSVMQ